MPNTEINNNVLNPSASPLPTIGFKMGTQSSLDTIIAAGTGAIHGTFYLTSDTHRLYVGNSNGTISPVNEGILTIASLSALETMYSGLTAAEKKALTGRFYYLSDDNILAVYNGAKWVQINQSSWVTGVETEVTAASNTATVTQTMTQANDPNAQQVSTNFKVTGSTGISVTKTSNQQGITITGNTVSGSVAAVSGNTKAADMTIDNSLSGVADTTIRFAVAEGTGNASSSVAVDATNKTITFTPKDTVLSELSVEKSSSYNGFKIGATDTASTSITQATLDPVITIGQSGSTSDVHFTNGTAALSVYTISQVDGIIANQERTLNAMTYRGKKNATEFATIYGAATNHIGDAYLLSANTTVGGTTYPAGTLAIARVDPGDDEQADGTIAAADLRWDFVEGNSQDTTYEVEAMTHGIKIINSNSTQQIGQFNLTDTAGYTTADNDGSIVLTDSGTSPTRTVNISHGTVTTTTTAETAATWASTSDSIEVNVVSGVVVKNGHVTQIKTKKYTLNHRDAELEAQGATVTASTTDEATITTGYKIGHDGTFSSAAVNNSFKIASSSLTLSAGTGNNANKLTMELMWGTF